MAKVNVIFGQMRGKVGGIVFRHDPDGTTVVSEYNPTPANPRTMLQTKQRGKMNMAGKISSMTPKTVLAGLDGNNRRARSLFVGKLLDNITPTVSNNGVSYVLQADSVVLSKGRSADISAQMTYAAGTNKLSVALTNNNPDDNLLGVIVMAYVADETWNYVCSRSKMSSASGSGTLPTVELSMPASVSENGGLAQVYLVPIFATEGAAAVFYSQFVTASETDLSTFNASAARSLATSGAYGASIFAGSETMQP